MKYSRFETWRRARALLRALEAGDLRANILLFDLGRRFGIPPNVCLQNIRNMANE